jgi:menaquinone-dependent protoporphyrinogen oxidase
VRDISAYQAFVIGSAYLGHWQQEAAEFVRHNHGLIQRRPTWLFSSGPLVKEPSEALGLDQREAAVPNEVGEFRKAICSRGDRVFAGALNPGQLGFLARAIRILPAGRALLPTGDFRDWHDIDAWADGIVRELVASHWRDGSAYWTPQSEPEVRATRPSARSTSPRYPRRERQVRRISVDATFSSEPSRRGIRR